MPDAWSTIRTVPGGKAGPPGDCDAEDAGDWAAGSADPPRPTSSAATTAITSPSTDNPTIQAVRGPVPGDGSPTGVVLTGAGGADGASSAEVWTATPGPAG